MLTLVTLAASGLFFLSALNLRASMIHTFDRIFGTRKYDLEVYLEKMHPSEQIERALRKTPGVARAESCCGRSDGNALRKDRGSMRMILASG